MIAIQDHIDVGPWIDYIREHAEAKGQDKAAEIAVEYRDRARPDDCPVAVTAKFGDRTYYGFGSSLVGATADLVRKIEPAPNLAAILGYEEVRS